MSVSLCTAPTYAASKTTQELVTEALPYTKGMTVKEKIKLINNLLSRVFCRAAFLRSATTLR